MRSSCHPPWTRACIVYAAENLNVAGMPSLFGRVTYEMMESAWRPPAPRGARPDWMGPFAQTMPSWRFGANGTESGTQFANALK